MLRSYRRSGLGIELGGCPFRRECPVIAAAHAMTLETKKTSQSWLWTAISRACQMARGHQESFAPQQSTALWPDASGAAHTAP